MGLTKKRLITVFGISGWPRGFVHFVLISFPRISTGTYLLFAVSQKKKNILLSFFRQTSWGPTANIAETDPTGPDWQCHKSPLVPKGSQVCSSVSPPVIEMSQVCDAVSPPVIQMSQVCDAVSPAVSLVNNCRDGGESHQDLSVSAVCIMRTRWCNLCSREGGRPGKPWFAPTVVDIAISCADVRPGAVLWGPILRHRIEDKQFRE